MQAVSEFRHVMHRCYIPPSAWLHQPLQPEADEAHHLLHVLRARAGDLVTVFDGQGRHAEARVRPLRDRAGRDAAQLDLVGAPVAEQPRPPTLALLQAVLKGPRMDVVIEKAAELGVTTLVPLATARVVVRTDADSAGERRARWERVALSAVKQCGTDWLPEIRPIVPLAQALAALPSDGLSVLGSLRADAPLLGEVLRREAARARVSVTVIIGPEGDLTEDEQAACTAAGVHSVSFGPRVLRGETAALFALSVIGHALEMG